MISRLVAITFIFGCTSVAWMILGGTILQRTHASDERLRDHVESIWGSPQVQSGLTAQYDFTGVARQIRPSSANLVVDLNSEPRKKGLLWYSTYKVRLRGEYVFHNPEQEKKLVRVSLRFPAAQAVYDGLQLTIDGLQAAPYSDKASAWILADAAPDATFTVRVSYESQGLQSWKYSFGESVNPIENFHLRMNTNFRAVDFPDNTLAPTGKRETRDGWQLDWSYKSLLSGYQIAMQMPEKLQPGPLASDISFFAPVSLFFFFFVIFIITTLRNIELHPMNYFFIAAAFFAFHLLIAYLADHLDIHVTFLISSAVSVFLVVSYLRLVPGVDVVVREAAIAQAIYLVLFSYAFFFEGLTGLSITIGAILTLFVVMQMTARIKWSEKFRSEAIASTRGFADSPLA